MALGSNLGDRRAYLQRACELLQQRVGEVVARSSVYETAPWACEQAQGDYLNQVVLLDTRGEEDAEQVLAACLAVERDLGRRRDASALGYQPRTIDIDLILSDEGHRWASGSLSLPHPLMHLRRFVLQPLCEIAPDTMHPILGYTVAQLLAVCPDEAALSPVVV